MNRQQKFGFALIFSPIVVMGISSLGLHVKYRKSIKEHDLEIAAKNHANVVVTRMFLDGKIRGKEQFDLEWQFAYMTYRAHR